MTGTIGVAISTTGHEHRLGFLETTVRAWRAAFDGLLVVTVDGSEHDARVVNDLVTALCLDVQVWKCGKPLGLVGVGRQGVAVNKNTGLELLMDARVDHMFLSDDDAWPLRSDALDQHITLCEGFDIQHSMVCWGAHRAFSTRGYYSVWTWPRGSVMYVSSTGVLGVGGFVEAFGLGGHEHVEWSRRFKNMGLTPDWYCAPISYAGVGPDGRNAMGARQFWYCEDMPLRGEAVGSLVSRRRRITSITRTQEDVAKQESIMASMSENPRFVPYAAGLNGRASATMLSDTHVTVPRSQS